MLVKQSFIDTSYYSIKQKLLLVNLVLFENIVGNFQATDRHPLPN